MTFPATFGSELKKRIQEWLDGPYDEKSKEAVRSLLEKNPKGLEDAFYTRLSFGTGGMRGLMGVGTNRLNIYTIRLTTQGLANYILKQKEDRRVVIGYDSRHNSKAFAEEAARVLAGNGVSVMLLKELRPTPYVSFAVRQLHCLCGIMITASHNPAEYNGYKVFWADGGQVVPPHDTAIMEEVGKVTVLKSVKLAELPSPLIEMVDEKLDQTYLDQIRPLQFFPEQNREKGSSLKICYTSLHGTGITLVPKALKEWGFTNLSFVEEQIKPDGDFPTVKFPNPEFKETLAMGIALLEKEKGDILIANDPDADRTGLVAMHQGKSVILTGNEIGALSVHFICEILKKRKKMPPKGAFVTTIVSTELMKTVAASYNIPCFEVLTGFKYIGEKIHEWELSKDGYKFLFGAEESYGFLIGTVARDKDAIISTCFISEMALDAKLHGETLVDRLHALYKTYGIFREKQYSLNFASGKEEMEQIKTLMAGLRKNPPKEIAGQPVVAIEDYETGEKRDLITGKKEALTLPKSDVLLFRLKDESKLIIRPSGTEPKVKLYVGVRLKAFDSVDQGITLCEQKLDTLISSFKSFAKI
ncbi:MAG: phospho-sugar mutase [Chlamydiales bacterium]|nr:phospho-sugar mutase [Chlamydiales bacterium]